MGAGCGRCGACETRSMTFVDWAKCFDSSASTSPRNFHTVDLAVSEFPGASDWILVGQSVFHTSIVVDRTEFYFDPKGIQEKASLRRLEVPPSHENKRNTRVMEVGNSRHSSDELLQKLDGFFAPGSYDIVHKNCNSFTDCALAFLLSRRLPAEYTGAEKLGKSHPNMLSIASGGRYKPNPAAESFNLEQVIFRVDEHAWMGSAGRESTIR